MQYRRIFGISWQQVMDMPADVFWQDLEMLSIEQSMVTFKNKVNKDR